MWGPQALAAAQVAAAQAATTQAVASVQLGGNVGSGDEVATAGLPEGTSLNRPLTEIVRELLGATNTTNSMPVYFLDTSNNTLVWPPQRSVDATTHAQTIYFPVKYDTSSRVSIMHERNGNEWYSVLLPPRVISRSPLTTVHHTNIQSSLIRSGIRDPQTQRFVLSSNTHFTVDPNPVHVDVSTNAVASSGVPYTKVTLNNTPGTAALVAAGHNVDITHTYATN